MSCDNNYTCNECSSGYYVDGNLVCIQIENEPYFGVTSTVLLTILGLAIGY